MLELLAIPGWQTAPTTLESWAGRLSDLAGTAIAIERESPEAAWITLQPLRLRGYAVLIGPHVEAINFELTDPEPTRATSLLAAAATALGWEIHEDDGEEDDDPDED